VVATHVVLQLHPTIPLQGNPVESRHRLGLRSTDETTMLFVRSLCADIFEGGFSPAARRRPRYHQAASGFRATPGSIFEQAFRCGVVVINLRTKYNPNLNVTATCWCRHIRRELPMRYSIQLLSTIATCLSLTSLAVAQTTPTQEQPPAQSPTANDAVGNLPPPSLPPQPPIAGSASPAQTTPATPAAPAAPITAPSATSVKSSTSTASSPLPPAPGTLVVRTNDRASNWTRGGFYLRIASGFGDVRVSGTGPNGSASVSGLGSNSLFAIGGNIVRGLVLAGTVQASTVSGTFNGGPFPDATLASNGRVQAVSSKADATAAQLGLLIDWYPNPLDGWHVGLSAGLGMTSIKNHANDSTYSGTGAAGSLFGGYDWAIGPAWSFGLALVASGTLSASLKDTSDQPDTGYRMKAYSIGISGSFLCF
jgi:hypothetical protein